MTVMNRFNRVIAALIVVSLLVHPTYASISYSRVSSAETLLAFESFQNQAVVSQLLGMLHTLLGPGPRVSIVHDGFDLFKLFVQSGRNPIRRGAFESGSSKGT